MVSKLENAKRAVRQKLQKQNEYQLILQAYDAFFEHEQNNQVYLNATIESKEHQHNDALKNINTSFLNKTTQLNDDMLTYDESLKNKLSEALTNYKTSIQQIETRYLQEKNKLEQHIATEQTSFNAQLKTYKNQMNKTLSVIQKSISMIKKNYSEAVQNIESTFKKAISSLQADYDIERNGIENKINSHNETFKKKNQDRLKHKEQSATSHDQDYINIKTYYNDLSKSLNQQINALKKYHQHTNQMIDRYFQTKKDPLLQDINALKQKKDLKVKDYEKQLKTSLNTLDTEKQTLEKTHKQEKKKIIAKTAEAVSTLNSKLSNFRELTTQKKQDILKQFHKKSQETKRIEVSQKNLQLNTLDDELNSLILKTKNLIKDKKIEGQINLFEHEKTYYKNLAKINHKKKRAYLLYDLNLKQLLLTIDQQERHLNDRMNRIEVESNALKQLLDIHKNFEMYKFETQVMIASETQERDLSQLTQDTFIEIADLDQEIKKKEYEYNQTLLSYHHELDILHAREEFDIEILKLTQSRQLEKASIIRDLDLEEQSIRESLSKDIFERKLKDIHNTHNEQVELYKHELDKLEASFDHDLQTLKYNYNKTTFNHQNQASILQKQTNITIHTLEFERAEQLMREKLIYFSSIIKHMFKSHYMTYSQSQQLRYMFNDFYHVPAHPDALRNYFTFYEEQILDYNIYNHTHYQQSESKVISGFEQYIYQMIETIKTIRYQDFEDEKKISIDKNTLKLSHIDEELSKFQVSLKRLPTSSNEFKYLEKEYNKTIKQKRVIESKTEKIELLFKRKIINYDLAIEAITKKHLRYLQKLKELFKSHKKSIESFHTNQKDIIQTLKETLYMSDSVLITSIGQSEKLEKLYTQKLNFHEQSMYETLTLHYELLMRLLQDEKSLKISADQHDLKTLKSKEDLYLSQHETMIQADIRQFRKQLVSNKQALDNALKSRKNENQMQITVLSKTISKQEQTLQTCEQKKNDSIAYHEINSNSLKQQLQSEFDQTINQLTSQFQDSLNQLKQQQQSLEQSFLTNITSTEQNIETRLTKYRMFVSKRREIINQKANVYRSDQMKFDQSLKHKRLQSKRKTKKLLLTIQKEKRRFNGLKQRSERRLLKSYHQKNQDMQKLIARSHRFKMRVLTFT